MDYARTHTKDYDVSSFIKEYNRLLCLEDTSNPSLEAARFIVTGYNKPEKHHARLDTLVHAVSPNARFPGIRRDFDSAVGFSEYIPVCGDLFIHPLPAAYESLSTSLGIKIPFVIDATVSTVALFLPTLTGTLPVGCPNSLAYVHGTIEGTQLPPGPFWSTPHDKDIFPWATGSGYRAQR